MINKRLICVLLAGLVCPVFKAGAQELPAMPEAVANNAVAALHQPAETGYELFSFAGLLSGKTWRDVTARAWWLPMDGSEWRELPPVPGKEGRLASVAVSANGAVWLFGGYTVAEDGSEVSTPETFRVDPRAKPVYQRMRDMPVPVDDAPALVYQDRYIYLISGWHDVGNVNLVQVYDTQTDTWQQATPWPGEPVFGQAAGMIGRQMLVCGGVRIDYPAEGARDFVLSDGCWQGRVSSSDVRRIGWRRAPAMPGGSRYRAAAAAMQGDADTGRVIFIGGSDNPYNYDGIGYNEQPSEPLPAIVSFDFEDGQWRCHGNAHIASMDHRGLLLLPDKTTLRIGGMLAGQQVSARLLKQPVPPAADCVP